jgi:choline dehydrogenase
MTDAEFDYVVIGSGAGGGPLAANLAKAGFRVLLMEAGGDPCSESDAGRLYYEVPIFHGLSTEYKECQWDYFVRHYADDTLQKQDSKFVAVDPVSQRRVDGIWYPRAGTLGGCTAHHAMITVTPQDQDWNYIAAVTGDETWSAANMNRYFARLENCQYIARQGSFKYTLNGLFWSIVALLKGRKDWRDWAHGHGFSGWLTTSEANPYLVLKDKAILKLLFKAIKLALKTGLEHPFLALLTRLDPNDLRNGIDMREGLAFTPLAVASGKRHGPRELLLKTATTHSNLTIWKRCLVTKILFDDPQPPESLPKAIGVEYYQGEHLYEADPAAREPGLRSSPAPSQVRVSREVILAAGAFNSPQLLKLSGVGPEKELRNLGIDVVANLPGVGENLQDRYEVGVIAEFDKPFELLNEATFAPPQQGAPPDPSFLLWEKGQGLYTSNGTLIGILKRSEKIRLEPDLYIFCLPGFFRGYAPGYSQLFERYHTRFTWAVLKAYTNNRAGRVTLESKDPTKWPRIDFHYFSEGSDTGGADLDAVVNGVQFVRQMNESLGSVKEICPGPGYDTPQRLREFIQNEAWGHHASCTNKIGADDDPMAVLDGRFRVRKTRALRVVDASVFPKIPGYFIVAAIYMVSEKAADVIIEDARKDSSVPLSH